MRNIYILLFLGFSFFAGFKATASSTTIVKDGVAYSCNPSTSCDEKLVAANKEIERLKQQLSEKKKPKKKKVVVVQAQHPRIIVIVEKVPADRNILSAYLVRSNDGFNISSNSVSTTTVEEKRDVGIGLMYQRRVKDNVYGGVAADTNNGVSISLGIGY